MVAAGHRESARAGALILARGGNAVDGACAAACAAAVAENPLTGPGAGGFLLARDPAGNATALDFFVAVPGLGPAGRRLDPADLDSFTVPFGGAEQEFHIGTASVAVPGMLAGLAEAAERLGRLPLGEVVAPAVRLATDGVLVTPEVAYLHGILEAMLGHTPEARAIYAPSGGPLRVGDVFRDPDLAETLREFGASGGDGARDVTRRAVRFLRERGGLVTDEDVERYTPITREPLRVTVGDTTILTNPPPSSGGTLIAAALLSLDRDGDLGDDVAFYRAVAAAGVAANSLRDERFLTGLAESGFVDRLLAELPSSRKPTGTTHVSVVDADGGMASLSSSCGSGSGVVVPGTGIILNNMLGEEDLNPGGFGRLAAGVRMTSMMAPSLIVRAGEPFAAIGSAGSNRLRSAILQTVVSILDAGRGPRAAVDRPRIHPERDGVDVEGGVPEDAVQALIADGHAVRRWRGRSLFFGGVAVASCGPAGLCGAGDPRRGGAAAGVTAAGEIVDL